MFVGHYGPAFAIRAARPALPLWLLFLAVQLVDIAWGVLVLADVEKVRIVPGITAASPLDLYYMPYTHGLLAAALWALLAAVACRAVFRWRDWAGAAWVGAAVFSHWILDWLVHRPDLPLYGDSAKVGLGLWNHVGLSLMLEALVLGGGLWLYLKRTRALTAVGRHGPIVFAVAALAMQVSMLFVPPPPTPVAVASSAVISYFAFAAAAWWIDRHRIQA